MPKFVATPGIVRILTEVKCKYELSKLLFCYSVEKYTERKIHSFFDKLHSGSHRRLLLSFLVITGDDILRGVPVEFSAGNGDFTAVGTV